MLYCGISLYLLNIIYCLCIVQIECMFNMPLISLWRYSGVLFCVLKKMDIVSANWWPCFKENLILLLYRFNDFQYSVTSDETTVSLGRYRIIYCLTWVTIFWSCVKLANQLLHLNCFLMCKLVDCSCMWKLAQYWYWLLNIVCEYQSAATQYSFCNMEENVSCWFYIDCFFPLWVVCLGHNSIMSASSIQREEAWLGYQPGASSTNRD